MDEEIANSFEDTILKKLFLMFYPFKGTSNTIDCSTFLKTNWNSL